MLTIALIGVSCKSSKTVSASNNSDKPSKTKGQSELDQTNFSLHFVDGCKERMKGNMETAENLFKQCLKFDPTSAPVKYELASIYRLNGLNELAIKYAKECANSDLKNEWYQLLYIKCLHSNGQYGQAADVFSRLIKTYPNRPDFYEGLASENMYNGEYEKAYKTYDELGEKFGQNETFILSKIKLLKELGKNNEVEIEFKKLLKLNPTEAKYYTYLAEFYQKNNQLSKAMDTYQEVLLIDPKNPMIHLALADFYKLTNDKEKFYKEIKIAFENPELDIDIKLNILASFFQLAEENMVYRQQANELLDIMLKLHATSSEVHSMKADILYRDNKIKEACMEYAYAIKLDKSKFTTWKQLMYLKSLLSDYSSLESISAEAMELFPTQSTAFYFNGLANIRLKNYGKAILSLNEGLEFVYENNPLLMEFYTNMGEAYNYLKNYEKSDKAFDNALKVNPDNSFTLNTFAFFLSQRNTSLDKAEKFSKRSIELSPNTSKFMETYGHILYQLGRYKEAEEWLGKAIKTDKVDGVLLEHYGDVLYKLDKKEEALFYWKEAKAAGVESELLNKKIFDKKINE